MHNTYNTTHTHTHTQTNSHPSHLALLQTLLPGRHVLPDGHQFAALCLLLAQPAVDLLVLPLILTPLAQAALKLGTAGGEVGRQLAPLGADVGHGGLHLSLHGGLTHLAQLRGQRGEGVQVGAVLLQVLLQALQEGGR